jgi:hypothetical protein
VLNERADDAEVENKRVLAVERAEDRARQAEALEDSAIVGVHSYG